jgi:hypothetical protein
MHVRSSDATRRLDTIAHPPAWCQVRYVTRQSIAFTVGRPRLTTLRKDGCDRGWLDLPSRRSRPGRELAEVQGTAE